MNVRQTRAPAAVVATAVLAATLSGCVTVHGEAAVIPAVSTTDAAKILTKFAATNNKASKTYDAGLSRTIETGALGAIDQAGLISRKKVAPGGNPDYKPLKLTDARFLIPKQAGWPKFFVADTRSNRTANGRWLFVFQRDDARADWKASYLAVLQQREMPAFVTGKAGYAKAVPTSGSSRLVVDPDGLSEAYVRYLQDGTGHFAPGPQTSARRAQRRNAESKPGARTEYADQAAVAPQYAPFGLRTRGGGALVFFASQHHTKQTVAQGYHPQIKDPLVKALMTGTPKQSVTYVRLSEQAARVPAKKDGGDITFLNRIDGLTNAKGE